MHRFLLSFRVCAAVLVGLLATNSLQAAAAAGPAPKVYVKDEGGQLREATKHDLEEALHASESKIAFSGLQRWDLGIYTLVVFGLLLFVLARFAWPAMREGLEKRETNIKSALEQAKQDAVAAKQELEQAKQALAKAAIEARGIVEEARRDAEALKATEREAGVKEAAAERERARREIETARDAALKDIYEQAVKLAALMSEKALARNISVEDHRRLLDESLAELKSAASKA
jgi:F-type H+-transporting ATPase subunit b